MDRLAIAMDLGTSGFRAQALDLVSGQILSTAITTRHPLPGANVIDHLHFTLEVGGEAVQELMVHAVNRVLEQLRVPLRQVRRLAVCGNPTQLSLFQGMEIRDLAYAGSRKLRDLGVEPPTREAEIRVAADFPDLLLPAGCEVVIPPAVHDEVGADALALILQSGLLARDKTAIAIDYGTNAEMALLHEGRIHTGSAAAGPALEGQHIACGILAAPGAIAGLEATDAGHRLLVLDREMQPVPGAVVDLREAVAPLEDAGPQAVAITGTGVIAALEQGLQTGAIVLPHIRTRDQRLHFGQDIYLTEDDVAEAGKAIGAIRAGYSTLCVEAGIGPADIHTAYLAGASGTYMDARKASYLGLVPPRAAELHQVGNTALAMARDLALAPEKLAAMKDLAQRLRETHCMFALSKTFGHLFVLELSHWTEGMPLSMYRQLLHRYDLPDLPPAIPAPLVVRTVDRDIDDLGVLGLVTVEQVGTLAWQQFAGCTGCLSCVRECPAHAISVGAEGAAATPPALIVDHALCNGVACRRCEQVCPAGVFRLNAFFGAGVARPSRKP
ncbi:MAG TPA: methylamine methyltransferase corrinoid protein reductive activase [Rhodocyclaceae bacterium]|nr:methylamine methyltransferase corrinoid protein reductive activase [Rhodocyclaceae bacterium]